MDAFVPNNGSGANLVAWSAKKKKKKEEAKSVLLKRSNFKAHVRS
jgi:hypothetical protein